MRRSFSVRTFCDTPVTDLMSSLKRLVPVRRSRRMSTTHLSLIRSSVVSTGQGGRSVIMPRGWMAWYFLWRMARWENPLVEFGKFME